MKAGEGAVITRSRDSDDVNVWRIGSDELSKWYLVEVRCSSVSGGGGTLQQR
jgi:hypothetical protein